MQKSETIDQLTAALSKAQAEMPSAKKSAKNGFYNSKYADLSAIIEAVNQPLTNNGLSYSQLVTSSPDGRLLGLETVLAHESGQWMATTVFCAMPPDMHKTGSALTYLRRYSLQAIAGVPAEDDDGNVAMGDNLKPQTKKQIASPKPLTEEQINNLIDLADAQELPHEKVFEKENIESWAQITDANYTVILDKLSKRMEIYVAQQKAKAEAETQQCES